MRIWGNPKFTRVGLIAAFALSILASIAVFRTYEPNDESRFGALCLWALLISTTFSFAVGKSGWVCFFATVFGFGVGSFIHYFSDRGEQLIGAAFTMLMVAPFSVLGTIVGTLTAVGVQMWRIEKQNHDSKTTTPEK